MGFTVIIPARYGSSRLPGKPLLPINGRPMVEHVWQRAIASGADRVCVATDDERIETVIRALGGEVRMTRADHTSGTDRLAEVV
ncbi:MAG TPA: NTP transferase domain-containing protein, partial [Gammaproteobacteria bacterium]|nr:NTP transferase domain-containing protein [Gammaproteobacteria bacterium]